MKERDTFHQVNNVFNSVLNHIETGNHISLSKIFEELTRIESDFLSEYGNRKKDGAYYTRESVANFIVSEGITLFLKNYLKVEQINSLDDVVNLNGDLKRKIKQKMLHFTVLDPACGSGAFLVNASDKIYELLRILEPELEVGEIKHNILKNIFGFEINDYTRKLCILKLFRWAYNENNQNNSALISTLTSNILLEDSLRRKSQNKYDLVIGNPPYGNILDKNQKIRLKSENIFYNDIYCAFIIKSLDWSDSIIGYLVPKSFLLRQGYVEFRNKLLSRANILKIYDIGPNLFVKATNEVQILFYKKKGVEIKDLEIFQYPNTKILHYPAQKFDSLRVCLNKACNLSAQTKKIYAYTHEFKCPYCNAKTFTLNRIRIKPNLDILNLINKIERLGDLNYLNIKRVPNMIRGEEDKGLKRVLEIVEENTNNSCYFIKAKDDFNYYYIKKEKSFEIEKIDPKLLKGNNYEFYTKTKLLIKHNSIFPQSVFSKEKVCFTSSIYSIITEDEIELRYLNAILNSSLIQFYCLYGINNQQNTTINLNQYMIRHLPIKNAISKIKVKLSDCVQRIINSLLDNDGFYSKEIINEIRDIDAIVFELYNLEPLEQDLITSEIKNQVDFYKQVYN
jgi:hypothetical protein